MTERPDGPRLTNPRAERVRAVRALSGRSVRRRTGRFLVEGPQGVREAVRWAPRRIRDVYLTPAAAQHHPEIVEQATDAGVPTHLATDQVVEAMSADAQGVVAVVDQLTGAGKTLPPAPRLVAVLCHVRDPGNAGTVIRAADAAGADAVVLTAESVDVHNPKVVRATAGSLFHLPVLTGGSVPEVVDALRGRGLAVLAADGGGEHDLDDLLDRAGGTDVPDLSAPTAWLLGNEAWGLQPQDRALADAVVRVPIHGHAESLNLAAAATLCLYASARAQRRMRS